MAIMAKKAVTVHQRDVTKVLSDEVLDFGSFREFSPRLILTVVGLSTDGNYERAFLPCPPECPFVFQEMEIF